MMFGFGIETIDPVWQRLADARHRLADAKLELQNAEAAVKKAEDEMARRYNGDSQLKQLGGVFD